VVLSEDEAPRLINLLDAERPALTTPDLRLA
jgi:hypothetical protein